MYSNITFAGVYWNEARRLPSLLTYVSPWFEHMAIGVQESDDETLAIAQKHTNLVVQDAHWGYGDRTFGPLVLPLVPTEWTFKVDGDEWPSADLLDSLGEAVGMADSLACDGVWVPFRSWVEGDEWMESHNHLRLFRTRVGWPHTMHSRPMIDNTLVWKYGHIAHIRSLDEMIRDYLVYYREGLHETQWVKHNREMMQGACRGVAKTKGWDYVKSFPWWPDVRDIAFPEGES